MMTYHMNPAIMECIVPFPRDRIPCPVCNRIQRDSSTFKTHARRVHKTLDVRTPTTCSICNRTFDTFRAGCAHYAKTHSAAHPKPPEPTLPSTPEACAFVEQLVNRSPPLTCSQEPSSTQELITELLPASPTRPFTPLSPVSTGECTSATFTTCSRSPSPEIAPPGSLHNRLSPRSPIDHQVADYLRQIRQSSNSPPASRPTQSTEAQQRLDNLNHLRATLAPEETDLQSSPPVPDSTPISPTPSPPGNLNIAASEQQPETARCPSPLLEDPSMPTFPTNETATTLEAFRLEYQLKFDDDMDFATFSALTGSFAQDALNLARSLSSQQRPKPAARRPDCPSARPAIDHRRPSAMDHTAAKRLQHLYRISKKRAARKIFGDDSPGFNGTLEDATTFFTATFGHRECNTAKLQEDLSNFVPSADIDDTLFDPPSPQELAAKLRTMANSAPGKDRLEYRHLRLLDPKCQILSKIYRHCFAARDVPSAWKQATTILIHKKESTSDPSNFRPIALMSCLYKLFMAVIAKRMTSFSINQNLLSTAQKSACPSEGCYEHAFTLESVLNDARRQPRPLCLAWLDIRNAFGSIPHAALSTTLLHMGFPPPLVQMITNIYTGTTTEILTPLGKTPPIPIHSGVKQGCPLSAILSALSSQRYPLQPCPRHKTMHLHCQ